MKKILTIIMCLCIIVSFSACQDTNNTTFNTTFREDDILSETNNDGNNSTFNNQSKVNIKSGSYIKSDTYIVSTGQHIFNEHTQTEYVYVENDSLLWYTQSGVLWTCKNYNYVIDGNKICCTPKYNNGLVDIEFSYNENNGEITIELNDIMLVFSYYLNRKPVDDVYKNM